MLAAGWDSSPGGRRRFVRCPVKEPHGRPPGDLAFGQAAHRWLLLGRQHRTEGHSRWHLARSGPWWTPEAEAGVRWVAGEECALAASSVAPLPVAQSSCDTRSAGQAGHLSEHQLLEAALVGMTGIIADAKEGEGMLRRTARLAAVTAAVAGEIVHWAPQHSEGDAVRSLRFGQIAGAHRMATGLLREAHDAEAGAIAAAAMVTAAASRAELIRRSWADGARELWRCGRRLLSAEGAAALDLAVVVVAGMTTALVEMRSTAARKLDYARWQVLSGERRVHQLEREWRCSRMAHRLWVEEEDEHWVVLVAAAAAAAVEVDGGDEAGAGLGSGGTDPGDDRGGGSEAERDGSRGQNEPTDGGRPEQGSADGGGDGSGTSDGEGAGQDARGAWIGEQGGWRAWRTTAGPGQGKLGEHREGVEGLVEGGGRRRRGARRWRPLGWRRWLCIRHRHPVLSTGGAHTRASRRRSAEELLRTRAVALATERWRVLGFTFCGHGLTGQTWTVGIGVGRGVLISSFHLNLCLKVQVSS
jgi:hypothetical protein